MTPKQINDMTRRARAVYERLGHDPALYSNDASIEVVEHAEMFYAFRTTEWLEGDDINFIHDLAGMLRHYDPASEYFADCFCPRYAGGHPDE